ncbi:cyclase-like protein 2 [Heracleum sosnowskyi]|uniref:Cyclase-like protein 2 n=1 Tax=Heracleum sosnowskyi TaxID=360622 RepID=A0AAD8IUG5_9APIA|nr:cyclase-like protein 2 [Heracleum sosnowskyi]
MGSNKTLMSFALLLAFCSLVQCQDLKIIDITHEYTPAMPSYGSKKGLGEILTLVCDQRKGFKTTNSLLTIQVHSGTHTDAPSHAFIEYYNQGIDATTLSLQTLNGPAIVVDVPRNSNITADVMKKLNIPRGVKRVLFRTLNTDKKLMNITLFDSSYVGFTQDGAQYLVDNTDIKLVGIDYLSIASAADVLSPHIVLMKNKDIIPLEGLKLDEAQVGVQYNIHCLPLKLHADASPVRCILTK